MGSIRVSRVRFGETFIIRAAPPGEHTRPRAFRPGSDTIAAQILFGPRTVPVRSAFRGRKSSRLSRLLARSERCGRGPSAVRFGGGHEQKYDDVRGMGFLAQARRERRASPPAVCKERATKPVPKRTAALRVAPSLACGFVARRLQPAAGMRTRAARKHLTARYANNSRREIRMVGSPEHSMISSFA